MNDLKQHIRSVFNEVHVMQLATVRDGQPWCCNVHTVVDDDFNIYWVSKPTVRHSQEIADNHQVAMASAVHLKKPVLGVQVEGTARMVQDTAEVARAMQLFGTHHASDPAWLDKMIHGDTPNKLYRLSPAKVIVIDPQTFPDAPQQILELG